MNTQRAKNLPPQADTYADEQQPAAEDAAMPRLLTVRELAALLGLHEKTIYDWTARGELPCVRLGKRLRFAPSDVLRWISARKEG